MSQSPKKQREQPRLADTNLMRYLGTMCGVNLLAFTNFDDAIAEAIALDCNIPEGLNEAFVVYERCNIRGVIWNLRERSELVQSSLQLIPDMDEDGCTEGAYLLLVDTTLPGKDGLFLVSVAVSADAAGATSDNIGYMSSSWMPLGKPAHLISGACALKDGSIFSAVAVQLSSLDMRRQD